MTAEQRGDPHEPPGADHDRAAHPRLDHLRDELEAAAIEAEFETGWREDTVEEAKRSLVRRLARDIAGAVLVFFGLILLVLPGPGLLVIAAGLALLAQDVPFAHRLLQRVRARLPEGADGALSKRFIVGSAFASACFMGGSLWWTFLR
jgi:hypothetical protein